MAVLSAIVLALLVGTSSAQNTSEHIWSSVAWVLHGERTPIWGPIPEPALTPQGAQQMFTQGSLLRSRYLSRLAEDDNSNHAPIVGIEANAIDNTQLTFLTNTDPFIVASALAFSQGLYPPIMQAFSNNSGGIEAAELANGTVIDYPLSGYQYPNLRTVSVLDFDSIWLQGYVGCTTYTESLLNFRNDTVVATTYNNTINFYQDMWNLILHEAFPLSMANYGNAYLLYDYANYRYNHDNATNHNVSPGEMALMARFAGIEQRTKNGNLSVSGDNQGDMIRAIAGRTMAAKTLSMLGENMRMGGETSKLNLAFTTQEAFIAFFALSGLDIGDSYPEFTPLPQPGSMMVFELFSIDGNETQYPDMGDLWVRFLYRNGTDPSEQLTTFPLFGHETKMPVEIFTSNMQGFDVNTIAQWCELCDSVSLFCSDLEYNSGSGTGLPSSGSNAAVSPTVAGVIGAAVTIAVLGLIFLLGVLIGGIRFHRTRDSKARNGTLGGFKGAEKMASDTDLAIAKGGGRHERTGSWELRGGGKDQSVEQHQEVESPQSTTGVSVTSRDLTHPSKHIDDDAISEIGHTPVKPREF